ncbi:MAG: ATP-dependent DNA ligase [Candidatus Aenigmarchaeota archaeon]|nr:ATP-dependent DNA ligase [Candidatus Aenigmarchaeota archaeon]
MDYSELADCYEKLESTTKKLQKRDILNEFYFRTPKNELYDIVLLSLGQVFPSGQENLGIASELMKKIIINVTGAAEKEFDAAFRETGDPGLAAERLMKSRKQNTLGRRKLTTRKVVENTKKLPEMQGKGSREKKIALISELLSAASPKEARYIVRTVLGEMRVGVAAGTVRDAIAKAFSREPRDIEHLFDVTGDFGRVATMAAEGKTAKMEVFVPVRMMLAERAPDLKAALEKFGMAAAVETKYDGFRIQAHKKNSDIKIFSRNLEEVSRQFPDIVAHARECMRAKQCIAEGEVVAIDRKGNPLPFQMLSRRIQRKHSIDEMVRQIPVQVRMFDIIYLEGENLMKSPLKERWSRLKETVKPAGGFGLAEHLETADYKEANAFYQKALDAGQEGVMVKNLDAPYQPGKRVGYWLKVKEIMETLDCIITKAVAGEGKRSAWFGSFLLSVWDEKKEKLVEIGKMASGTTEEELEKLTQMLKKAVIREQDRIAEVMPEIVVEVAYEEIQKSPTYDSGMALRFPRLKRIRYDKGPADADNIKRVKKLFAMQAIGKSKQ